jgi:recombinational DNA repair protein (RecF pathway)
MSYHVYTTEGIILKRTPFGEANILLHVLTLDLGLIIASARSARLSVSKLRPALQEYAQVTISMIHGKGGWKITNVVEKNNFFFDVPMESRSILAKVASVLMQMIPGESVHPEIFQTVRSGFEFLKTLSSKKVPDFECLMLLRILYQLGYVVNNSDTQIFLAELDTWDSELLEKIYNHKNTLIAIINKALHESQL